MAMMPAPENWMNGIAEITATAMQVQTGVCSDGDTFERGRENGSWLSRDIPKHSRMVAAMIDRQQTKMAADTTNRYTVAKLGEKFASMMLDGPQAPEMAVFRFGIDMSVPSRNTPPMMNAPITA